MPRKTTKIEVVGASPTCGACQFWHHDEQDEQGCGHCKFNPPVPLYDPEMAATFTAFPMVEAEEGACGQLKGRH